jgi:hypothetical protein
VVWACSAVTAAALMFPALFSANRIETVYWGIWPAMLLFKVGCAILACNFFVESRRNGVLELLAATPLTTGEILHGQWQALARVFLWPSVVLVGVAGMATAISAGMAVYRGGNVEAIGVLANNWLLGYRVVVFGADMLAAGWVGMWVGLTINRLHLAGGLSILYVVVLPSIFFCVPDVIIALVLILLARNALTTNLRRKLANAALSPTANPAHR